MSNPYGLDEKLFDVDDLEGNFRTYTHTGTVQIITNLAGYGRTGIHVDENRKYLYIFYTSIGNINNFQILNLLQLTPYFASNPAVNYYPGIGSVSMLVSNAINLMNQTVSGSIQRYIAVRRNDGITAEVWKEGALLYSINVTTINANYGTLGIYLSISGKYLIIFVRDTVALTFHLLIFEAS